MHRVFKYVLGVILICFFIEVRAFDFSVSRLGNESMANPTSLQFGPDGRLYVSEQFGKIHAYTIVRNGANDYAVVAHEQINLINTIPNFDDNGSPNASVNTRQVTGILVTGTSNNPVLYVTSSDPRIGAGASGESDLNLDTNSGVISRLTWNSTSWDKVDLVRGLPRSEENHATNGMQLDAVANILYVAVGGNTNAGSPSTNFAFASEYALSAAILSVDLTVLDSMPVQGPSGGKFVYDLPTLDDPTRTNIDGKDGNDPFGGNDGLNQAKLVNGGPVQIYASGFRNPYDLIRMKSAGQEGRMYTFDNAANPGWGGYPYNEGPAGNCTNQYVDGELGSTANLDGLHFVTGAGYYGGHPNPVRGNPGSAGLFRFDSAAVFELNPTVDWPPVPVSMADSRQCDYRKPGVASGALLTNNESTNGLTEYTAATFSGGMQGNLIATAFDGSLLRIEFSQDGTSVLNGKELLATNLGSQSLDVTAPTIGDAFEGSIWVALYGDSDIAILEPGFQVCQGLDSPLLDEDQDGYSNSDEIANGSDPCSGSLRPPDADGDLVSDLQDADDDNDGLNDTLDTYPVDPINGFNVVAPLAYDLFNGTGVGFFGLGFTGVMGVPGTDYRNFVDTQNVVAGGTAGLFTISSVTAGTPLGSANSLMNGFQFGLYMDATSVPQVISSKVAGPLFGGAAAGGQFQGIYIGNGDQDNYLAVNVHANNGAGGIQVLFESAGQVIVNNIYQVPQVLDASSIELFLVVDPAIRSIQPQYSVNGGIRVDVGSPVTLQGALLDLVLAQKPVAIGLLASNGGASPFAATWDNFSVNPILASTSASIVIDPNGASLNGSTYGAGSFKFTNLSTAGERIISVELDLSTALLPDLVYDPLGTAGDAASKGFTVDSDPGVGLLAGTFTKPHNGANGGDGYDSLVVGFNNFDVGETFQFSVDTDPTSIKGANNPGPNESGSVSGLELSGATAIVKFDDGSTRQARVFYMAGSVDRSEATIQSASPPSPHLAVGTLASPASTPDASQTITISGVPGASGQLYVFDGGLYTAGVPGGGYDLDPFESNSIVFKQEMSFLIGANGLVDAPITLTKSDGFAGFNYITAAVRDGASNVFGPPATFIIKNESVLGAAVYRLNAGGPNYTDGNGNLWSADSFYNTGIIRSTTATISGTADQTLYKTERYDAATAPELVYTLPVSNGSYTVRLHFAEIVSDKSTPGSRIFNVKIEGITKLSNYDIVADAGYRTAVVKEFANVGVTDGNLNIEFLHVLNNPKISAIEVIAGSPSSTPNIGASAGALAFGDVATGTGSQLTATLSNTGSEALQVSSLAISGDAAFTVVSPVGGFSIAAGGSRTVTVAFNPTSTGAKNGTLQVNSNDPDQPQLSITLSGQGISGGTVALYRLNAGGPNYTDSNGNLWSADSFYNTGKTRGTSATISGTADQTLYKKERWDAGTAPELMYTLPVSNGSYTVRLHFAEIYSANSTPGSRIFNVKIEGSTALSNYNIVADVGYQTAVVKEFTNVGVTDGNLNIEFLHVLENPKISAIEVIGSSPSYIPDISASPLALNFGDVATGTSTQLTTTLSNTGSTPLEISNLGTSGNAAFTAVSPVGGFSIPVGGSQVVTVAFTPTTTGAHSGMLLVDSNDPDQPQLSITLSGQGISGSGAVVVYRLNAGGPNYTDSNGNLWSADSFYNTGIIRSTTATITGTTNQTLYKTERYDAATAPELVYTLPVSNGSYTVRLHFAEIVSDKSTPGSRIFNVKIEGSTALSNYDIVADAGYRTAVVKEFSNLNVTDGNLNIEFLHVLNNPKISAIEVIRN